MYLKEFREKTGLSQKDFAERLELTQVTITRYETEKMNPTTTVIQKYIDVFQANPNYLFLGLEPHTLVDVPKFNNDIINLLNELNILMSENEIKENLNKIILEKIIDRFKNTSSSLIIKFLSLIHPDRPLLFMYYIAQIIEDKISNENPTITKYQDFLISVIKDFPIWKIFFNQPLFTEKIKKEFIQIIEYKLTEEDCKLIVENYKNTLVLLEEKMPSYIILAHRNKFK
jgi:transcriptional regulator with XRE-family HTH domain